MNQLKTEQLTTLALLLALLLVACQTNDKQKTPLQGAKQMNYQIEKYSTSYHLFNDAKMPACQLSYSFPRLLGGYTEAQRNFAREQFQKQFFSPTNGGQLLPELFRIEAELVLSEYRDLERDYALHDTLPRSSLQWEIRQKLDILLHTPQRLAFRIERFQSTGGAFPLHTSHHYVLDMLALRPLALNDLWQTNATTQLKPLLLAKLQARFATPEEFANKIWVERLAPSPNFLLTDSSLSFFYNPVEIGSHELGAIEIRFSHNELQGLLKKEFTTNQ